jgi:hypothetical protein
VQTFLPYADFASTMEVLDRRRLGKQRVECIQIVRGLVRPGYAWRHHPAVKMWSGCLEALGAYGLASVRAWVAAGFADTCADTIRADLATAGVTHVRRQAELAEAGALPFGSVTRRSTAATSRRCSARTPTTMARCSRESPTTCPTSGRRDERGADPQG